MRPSLLERVDDAAVVQVYADGFAFLPLGDKILVWHLYLAAIAGRDIFYDQRYAHNLDMRDVLEGILTHASGVDEASLAELRRYTKLFWINTGPYNNLTARKFVLKLTPAALLEAVAIAADNGARFPQREDETLADMVRRLSPMFFDVDFDPFVTNKSPGGGRDILEASANNLYAGVTLADLAGFDERYGLNSRLVQRPAPDGVGQPRGSERSGQTDRRLVEEVYRAGGKYSDSICRIIRHLEDALPFATPAMAEALRALIYFYRTGEEIDRERHDIAWVRDRDSPVDTINGFIEVYLDPRGIKGAWEALVYYVNVEKTRKIETLAANAQWFEDRMPWDPRFRKSEVLGVTAKAVDVVIETGESGPITPIGINLPNEQKIREQYGSKSVSLANINEAYDRSTPEEFRVEFSWSASEVERAERWGAFANELSTDLHEVIGHGSGRMADDMPSPQVVLKEHFSALEESRADLVALYFLPDPKLVELGIVTHEDHAEVVRTAYEYYARNALVQLRRVREGTQIEADHMRNRQMIVNWLIAHTTAIDVRRREEKTYYVMTDAEAFRAGVARLLAEVQRIKATGDYEAAKGIFDAYGVHFDPTLRDEVVARADALALPSYTGFVMPRLQARYASDGSITDVEISYPLDLTAQMLEFSRYRDSGFGTRDSGLGRDSGFHCQEPMKRTPNPESRTPSHRFSRRLPLDVARNRLSDRLAAMRAAATPYIDLTESNPTRAGFTYPPDLLEKLADPRALRYEPHPFGLSSAREAVAADFQRRAVSVDPTQIVLSASTSESYAWLFKLLCSPGDRVLAPRPSYPLFEHLTRLEAVETTFYDIEFHGRWEIDFASLEGAVSADTRALLVVSPNNPTGTFVKQREVERLMDLCRHREIALIVDEVFVDYPLNSTADRLTDIAAQADALTFTLGGLSKSVALPQLKLGWILVGGQADVCGKALEGLELIADNYLSVSTPVQLAARDLLSRGASLRRQICERLRGNLTTMERIVAGHPSCELLPVEGGWYAVIRVPASRSEEELVVGLLDDERLLVHPGYFFDFPREAYIIVSLLPAPAVFDDAVGRLLRYVAI